jgi:hypothetical protein
MAKPPTGKPAPAKPGALSPPPTTKRRRAPKPPQARQTEAAVEAAPRSPFLLTPPAPGERAESAPENPLLLAVAPLLGQQTADLTHLMDRWFETVAERLAALESLVAEQAEAIKALGSPAAGAPEPPASASAEPESEPNSTEEPASPPPRLPPPELVIRPLFGADISSGWDGWSPVAAAMLNPGGRIAIDQETGGCGVVSDLIRIASGGLYRVVVTPGGPAGAKLPRLVCRLTDAYDEWLGPEAELAPAANEMFFYVPHRVRAVKLSIICLGSKAVTGFELRSVVLEKVDEESYFRRKRHDATSPVIASMASIPSRRAMLRDAVDSLLLQCDRVRVFLNDYAEVPKFLHHARVEFRRSQDWDDKGDAGKFGWIDGQDEPGLRVIADDDLLFPPDFVRHMSERLASYDNHAFVAVHGVLLRQPVTQYYAPESRHVLYFESSLKSDQTVHVLGSNALVYHSSILHLRQDDFMFRNMADIFLARYAKENAIPMIAVARPWRWVRQNTQATPFDTIYESSKNRTRSKFDSSLVQDCIVKQIAPLTLQPTMRPKLALCIAATDPAALDAALASWVAIRDPAIDWVLLVAPGTGDAELRRHVASLKAPAELHLVIDEGLTPAGRVAAMLTLACTLAPALIAVATDAVRFASGGWAKALLSPIRQATYLTASCDVQDFLAPDAPLPVLASIDPQLLKSALAQPMDSANAAEMLRAALTLQSASQAPIEDDGVLAAAIQAVEPEAALTALGSAAGRYRPLPPPGPVRRRTVNEVFERVAVINLDRRADRWAQVASGLQQAGITAQRWRAVDGQWREVAREYAAYAAGKPVSVGPEIRPVTTSEAFFFDYDSQRARVAHIEADGAKAIASAGAWAYLKSWEALLEQALVDRVHSLLVFDDDVVFHRYLPWLFAEVTEELPADWLILQLGTLQYHWETPWMEPAGRYLYRTNGSAVGSHAVGLQLDMIPFVLDHIKRRELPVDIGALAAATRAFAQRCFVTTPNLAIQRLADTDIKSSVFQQSQQRDEVIQTYRWKPEDYLY